MKEYGFKLVIITFPVALVDVWVDLTFHLSCNAEHSSVLHFTVLWKSAVFISLNFLFLTFSLQAHIFFQSILLLFFCFVIVVFLFAP